MRSIVLFERMGTKRIDAPVPAGTLSQSLASHTTSCDSEISDASVPATISMPPEWVE